MSGDMGEWSKKVGEAGEAIAAEFLRMIGWDSVQHGIELPCVRPDAHKTPSGGRRTHGIDYLFTLRSSLVDGIVQNLIVSVKYSAKPYPDPPMKLFKEHFADLAQTLECFKNSEVRQHSLKTFPGATKTQDVGVLLWINSNKISDGNVIAKTARVIFSDDLKFEAIYVVDNSRAQFIYDSMSFAGRIAAGDDVSFFYADTGKNVHPLTKATHGGRLPVEYINGSVLPIRISDKASTRRVLVLASFHGFSEGGLKRLLGLAQSLSQGWCTKVVIAFPDYDGLHHENLAQSAKASFTDYGFTGGVAVDCYDSDFRSMKR